jgi:hypothetical protein
MPCTTAVRENGTMTVSILRGGVRRTAKVHVTAVPCVTNDSILDDPVVRRFADSLWKLSNWTDTASRVERAMSVVDSAGVTIVRIKPVDPTIDNPCRSTVSSISGSGLTLLAIFHTHPAAPGDTVNCHDGTTVNGYSKQFGGPSPADWHIAHDDTHPGPSVVPNRYVIDPTNVYHYDGTNVDGSDVLQRTVGPACQQVNEAADGFRLYITSLDTATSAAPGNDRTFWHLPQVSASEIAFVTDSTRCDRAARAHARTVAADATNPAPVHLLRVGPTRYIAFNFTKVGEWFHYARGS